MLCKVENVLDVGQQFWVLISDVDIVSPAEKRFKKYPGFWKTFGFEYTDSVSYTSILLFKQSIILMFDKTFIVIHSRKSFSRKGNIHDIAVLS